MALVLLSAVASGTAMAKKGKTCAEKVVDDWYDDGRVGTIYPLHCYREAIKDLPPDVIDYGNAAEEIGRALAFAKRGQPDPGGKDPTPSPPTDTGTGTTGTGNTGTGKTGTGKTGTGKTGTGNTGTGKTGTGKTPTDTTPTDTSGPSSVPIPLLVLGGLAVLLLAAGSAGYLRRRMDGDGDGDGDGTPPAAA